MSEAGAGLRDVYITGVGAHLPGPPVGADRMEDHIGRVHGRGSVVGRRALRWNGIQTRHYAMAPDGTVLDTNAGMTAKAVAAALDDAGLGLGELQHLATATSASPARTCSHAPLAAIRAEAQTDW